MKVRFVPNPSDIKLFGIGWDKTGICVCFYIWAVEFNFKERA